MTDLPYQADYAKSGRATCKECKEKIKEGVLRIAIIVQSSFFDGKQFNWRHEECFFKKEHPKTVDDIGNFYKLNDEDQKRIKLTIENTTEIPQTVENTKENGEGKKRPAEDSALEKADQDEIKDEIEPINTDEIPSKKLKKESTSETELEEENEEEPIVKQNKLVNKYRQALSDLTKVDLKIILEANGQKVPSLIDERVDRVADCMAFGALEPCSECNQGQFVLSDFGYKCTGYISDWSKCSNITQTPSRVPMKIPEAYVENNIFKTYEPKTDVRLFKAELRPMLLTVTEDKTPTYFKKGIPALLKNLQFFLYGKLKKRDEIKKRIRQLGGFVHYSLIDKIAAVVSTKADVEAMAKTMKEIKSKGIEVVEQTFFDLIEKDYTVARSLELIKEKNIADWGSDPASRVPVEVVDGNPAVKLKVKGGTAVDPESNLQNKAHVYYNYDGTQYNVVLSQTDVVEQRNSFYKIQVLKSDKTFKKDRTDKHKFWLFRSWGRTGTTIGSTKVEDCTSAVDAVNKFKKLYLEKTGNKWEDRHEFKKVPGRYFPLDVEYGGDEKVNALTVDPKSDLHVLVQRLVIRIFDVDAMRHTLHEFEVDTKKMPLGKLSKEQIMSAYKILSELLLLIENGTSQNKVIDATNRFFTLIPHDFGTNNAPLLDTIELIKTKTAMLDNMLEIEIAYSMMNRDVGEFTSISALYLKLKTDIVPLPTSSPEFEMIQKYVTNTHGPTHKKFKLSVKHVFKVVREGEEDRYKPFSKLHNRQLLWHGSRITNFAGIISQGLRIAPPEAPTSGYMFGKGIYFADAVSKSANYCATNKYTNLSATGLMLLCEVALGNMKECYEAEGGPIPSNMHSRWGIGIRQPDASQNYKMENGTIVPLGKLKYKNQSGLCLQYNEFIVYKVEQVNVKYLLQMKFNYDRGDKN